MSGNESAATSADVMQAEYFRDFFAQERLDLEARLASHTRRLTECTTVGDMTLISHVRYAIRQAESELRVIDRMVAGLNGRFPVESDVRRRA